MENSHAFKSISYDIGRPDYPVEFYDYLYNEGGLNYNSVIADIGAGTGKVTKGFFERGNKVYAIEPDKDMMLILNSKLNSYTNCIAIKNNAEYTGIPADTVDFIFCGNSYQWFEREKAVPELKRIVRSNNNNKNANIIIATLGPDGDVYTNEYVEILSKFAKPTSSRASNHMPAFKQDTYITKVFEYVVHQDVDGFLNGALSASFSPIPQDSNFDEFCTAIKLLFKKYSNNESLESHFKLSCMLSRTENLVL